MIYRELRVFETAVSAWPKVILVREAASTELNTSQADTVSSLSCGVFGAWCGTDGRLWHFNVKQTNTRKLQGRRVFKTGHPVCLSRERTIYKVETHANQQECFQTPPTTLLQPPPPNSKLNTRGRDFDIASLRGRHLCASRHLRHLFQSTLPRHPFQLWLLI